MPLTRIKLTAIADGGITTAKLSNVLNLSGFDVTLPQGVGGTNWTTTPILTPTSDNSNISGGGSASGDGYLVSNSSGYFVNTSDGTVTIKLPGNPQQGNYVSLVDYAGTNDLDSVDGNGFYTNRIQINPNGNKINGSTNYLDIGAARGGAQLVYVDSTQGWIVTDSANEDTAKSLIPSTPRINIGGVLNTDPLNPQPYFQDTIDELSGRTIKITGSGFLSGLSVHMIDSDNNTYTDATVSSVTATEVVFVVPQSVITAASGDYVDLFDVKVVNSNGSFVVLSDALQFAPRPAFALNADTLLGTVSDPSNTTNSGANSFDSFTTLTNATISATSLDTNDDITYAITNNGGLTDLVIDSISGALSGTQSTFPAANTLQEYNVEITATATTRIEEDSNQPQVIFARNFKILVEGAVSAPTISSVELGVVAGDNYFSTAGNVLTITGTGFADKPVVVVQAADNTEYTITANDVTYSSPTTITFVTTADMVTKGQVQGDERFNVKVTNPNSRTNPSTVPGSLVSTGAYEKTSGFVSDLFEYFGNAPTISPTTTNIGTLSAGGIGTVDYTTLTTTSFTITTLDPDDTIQSVAISNNSNLPGLGASITSNTPSSKVVTLTGTNSSDITTAGNYTFNLDIVTESDYGGATRTASTNQQYIVTIASASNSLAYDSNIQNSLMFDGTSSYLQSQNTSSTGSTTTWTWSCWVKRSSISSQQTIIEAYWSGTSYDKIEFNSGDILSSTVYSSSNAYSFISTELFRDTSAWYHIVWVWDTTNAATDSRHVIYVNGSLLNKASGTSPASSLTSDSMNRFTSSRPHVIGYHGYSNSQYSNLYLADVYFIDGQALDSSYFGKTDTDSGVWIPKTFDGTSSTSGQQSVNAYYGTNGFHLDFSPSSLVYNGTALTTVNDVSGRGNHWTAN